MGGCPDTEDVSARGQYLKVSWEDACLVQSVEHVSLDPGGVSSRPIFGLELTKKKVIITIRK